MRNIRKSLPEDELFIISNRLDHYMGNKDFYDIPNNVLLNKKKEIEQSVKKTFEYCKILIEDGENIGSFAVYPYEDGVVIDSIALKSESDSDDAKEFIIKFVISSNYGYIYTFVPINASGDLDLYKRLGFEVIETKDGQTKLKLNNF